MEIKVEKKDAIWSYLAVFMNIGINLIQIPIVLIFLNDDNTALYYVFISLSSLAAMLDFGFSPAIARSMAYAWVGAKKLRKDGAYKTQAKGPNYILMKKIATCCRLIYAALSLTAIICSLTIGSLYISYIMRNSAETNYLVSWIVYAIAISLNILFGYYSVFLRGIGAIYKVNVATVISKLTQLLITVVLLVLGLDLLSVSIGFLSCAIIFLICARLFFYSTGNIKNKFRNIKISNKFNETKTIISAIWPNTWREGMGILSIFLCNQSSTIISSLFLTLLETGIFSLATQLGSVLAMVAGTMYTTYEPSLQSAYAKRNRDSQKRIMSFIVVSYITLYIIGLILLLTIGLPIVEILKPSYKIPIILMLLVGIYQGLLTFRNCYSTYFSTTNRLIYWKSFMISAILCITLSILLTKYLNLGMYGLVTAQILSQAIYNIWHWPIKAHNELKLKISEMPKYAILELKKLINKN